MDQEKIGRFISELRKDLGLTQQELADKLGITDRAVSKWENGRGMPDYTLIMSLCEELGITVNELLCGERILKEEMQRKSDENIIKTMSYSKEKVDKVKSRSRVILFAISGVALLIACCFCVDVIRMRNNENVIFSTWGFKYFPPLHLSDVEVNDIIEKYFEEEAKRESNRSDAKSFVSTRIYLLSEKKNKICVYAWILEKTFYEENGELVEDSGYSIPFVIDLRKEDDSYVVDDYQIPRDGSNYYSDMKKMFPNDVLNKMDRIYEDGTAERLESNIQKKIDSYKK